MSSKVIEGRLPCPNPSCGSSDAYHLYDDGHGYCFSCQYFKPSNKREEFISEDLFTYEYLPHRGLSRETLAFYDIKTKINSDGEPISVGFKYPFNDYKVRDLKKKEFKWVRSKEGTDKSGLFGRDKFSAGSHKYVTITEGEYDAASLYQVLHSPVVSVQSASTAVRDCTAERAWLNSFERVYLAFDGDQRGRDAERDVAKLFDFNKLYQVKFDRRKDASEYLQHGEADELRQLWNNAKKYLPETIVSSLYEFKKILSERQREGFPYPFAKLNDMTYGIRRGESVLITAQEGIGKTSVMHAIEHKILKETTDAVGGIFIEEPKRIHLQSLAGIELRRPVHLPESGCSDAQINAAVESLVQTDDRFHLYSHFGSDDPDVLLDTIRFLVSARSCWYVLFDHITMAVTGLANDDERRALDYISSRLEMMVKELDFALIFVSHVNDLGQTRGSRNISKIADIRIDLTRDLVNPDAAVRNVTNMTVSKNRFCGRTGPAGSIIFDPYTRHYTELNDGVQQTVQ